MRYKILLLGLACIAAPLAAPSSAARPAWLDVNVTSRHSEKGYFIGRERHRFNSNNFGLGLTWEPAAWWELKAGWFDNSYHKTSVYGAGAIKWNLLGNGPWIVAPGALLGALSGYQNTPEQTGEITPWGLATLTLGHRKYGRLNLGYLPSKLFKAGVVDVLTVQVGIKL